MNHSLFFFFFQAEDGIRDLTVTGVQTCALPSVDYAKRMGITSPLQPNLSLALGTNDVTLMEMASAFGTLATLGVHADPIAVLRVTDREGRVLEERTSRRTLALGADRSEEHTSELQS